MGYSGYTQYLCANGHSDSRDCMDDRLKVCSFCSVKMAWENGVDTTNGSRHQLELTEEEFDAIHVGISQADYEKLIYCSGCKWCVDGRIDGHVALEVAHPARTLSCECCNHEQELEPVRYKIPTNKGRRT
jgi:hypothetical protein